MSEGVRLYAGTQHGLIAWKSTACGWQEVAHHFEDGIIDSIHGCKQSPETVFVGVTHDGLYRTTNGGKSWSKVFEGDIRSVTVDASDDKVVYTGIEPVGLFRSEDGGNSWQEITALKKLPQSVRKNWWYPQAPHHGHVRNIHIHPDDPQTIYLCLEHGGIVRSFDRGA
ncbi:MAG: WD40/YVTN/BNR-like repeat-containing protein, partial [Candidatus Binatia bacterium]